MKALPVIMLGILALGIAGCSGHRRDEQPVPDGDTVRVVIKEPVTISEELVEPGQDNQAGPAQSEPTVQ